MSLAPTFFTKLKVMQLLPLRGSRNHMNKVKVVDLLPLRGSRNQMIKVKVVKLLVLLPLRGSRNHLIKVMELLPCCASSAKKRLHPRTVLRSRLAASIKGRTDKIGCRCKRSKRNLQQRACSQIRRQKTSIPKKQKRREKLKEEKISELEVVFTESPESDSSRVDEVY